jgi:transposase
MKISAIAVKHAVSAQTVYNIKAQAVKDGLMSKGKRPSTNSRDEDSGEE